MNTLAFNPAATALALKKFADANGSILLFFTPDDLGKSFRNGLLVLLAGLSVIGNNSLCSRLENAVFNVCGITITIYGIAHELAVAFTFIPA